MKKISTLIILAIIFMVSSCSKEEIKNALTDKVTIVLNDGANNIQVSPLVDTIEIDLKVTCSGSLTASKIYISRTITSKPGSEDTIYTSSPNKASVNQAVYDVRTGTNLESLSDNDVVTYAVSIVDSKNATTTQNVSFVVKSLLTSGNVALLIGATANTNNIFKFLGTANNFQRYSIGADSSGTLLPARTHSSKVDFLFYSNMNTASVQAAIYSPDYPFGTGEGWQDEISTWPTKNKTIFLNLTDFTLSNFDADVQCIAKIRDLDFSTGTNVIRKLSAQQVIAFRTHDGKRGLMLFADVPQSDKAGLYQVKVKMEP